MLTHLKYGSLFLAAGSAVTIFLGLIGFTMVDLTKLSPLTYFTVGIPAAIFMGVVFGVIAVILILRDAQAAPVGEVSGREVPSWASLLPVLGVGLVVAVVAAIMYSLDVGPGFNFGFGWAMGGFVPVGCALVCGLLYLGARGMRAQKVA